MHLVTLENREEMIEEYRRQRGGENNEDTYSEACFVAYSSAPDKGAFALHDGFNRFWVGLQNSTARVTNNGVTFESVPAAIALAWDCGLNVFLSTDSSSRLRTIADWIDRAKGLDREYAERLAGDELPRSLAAMVKEPDPVRKCNRHDDCDAADEKAREKGFAFAEHCDDDCCEDCFGS